MDFLKQQFVGTTSSSNLIEDARSLFDTVAEIFPKGQSTHASLPWTLGVSSTHSCLALMKIRGREQMVEEFVNDYLFKIVNLLLQQQYVLSPCNPTSFVRSMSSTNVILRQLSIKNNFNTVN